MSILVVNSGSSSIKFSVFEAQAQGDPSLLLDGELTGIGTEAASLSVGDEPEVKVEAETPQQALGLLCERAKQGRTIDSVGYRVVHPGPVLDRHQRITPEVLTALEAAKSFAPLHDPEAVAIIREGQRLLPGVPHFACFDTVFHNTMPEQATIYPIPAEYREQGVRRFGFHGLSYESVVHQMQPRVPARLVIAHLGSGCSVTALRDGRSVDTSMGLTPTGGVLMGTRPGDLDPGLVFYLLRQQKGSAAEAVGAVEAMLNHHAGLAALTGLPNDMKQIRKAAHEGNEHARLALAVFTRSIAKTIGGYMWLLGGLDALVFTGGIGEHDPATRTEVLAGLEPLGFRLDEQLNTSNSHALHAIAADGPASNRKSIFVCPAQEDLMIAIHVSEMVKQGSAD